MKKILPLLALTLLITACGNKPTASVGTLPTDTQPVAGSPLIPPATGDAQGPAPADSQQYFWIVDNTNKLTLMNIDNKTVFTADCTDQFPYVSNAQTTGNCQEKEGMIEFSAFKDGDAVVVRKHVLDSDGKAGPWEDVQTVTPTL